MSMILNTLIPSKHTNTMLKLFQGMFWKDWLKQNVYTLDTFDQAVSKH